MSESSTEEIVSRDDVIRWLHWARIIDPQPAYWDAVCNWVMTKPDAVGNVRHWKWLLRKLWAVRKNGRDRA